MTYQNSPNCVSYTDMTLKRCISHEIFMLTTGGFWTLVEGYSLGVIPKNFDFDISWNGSGIEVEFGCNSPY